MDAFDAFIPRLAVVETMLEVVAAQDTVSPSSLSTVDASQRGTHLR